MEIYILLMVWSILAGFIFFNERNLKIKKKIYFILVYIPLILVSGLRGINVGTDTSLFHQWFYAANNIDIRPSLFLTLSDGSALEFGFVYICYLFNTFSINVQVLIFLVSALTIGGIGYGFYRYSKSLWLSTFLFIALYSYQETFNMARQAIVVMIMFNAYGYLRDNFRLKYFITIIVSMFFHFTALVYMMFVLLMPIKMRKIILLMAMFFVIFCMWDMIVYFSGDIAPKYLHYINSEYTASRSFGPGIIQIIGIMFFIGITWILNKNKKFNLIEKKEVNICNTFMLFSMIEIIGQYIVPLLARFNPYCFIYIDLLIPLILSKLTNISMFTKYIIYVFIVLCGFIYCIYSMYLGKHEVVPYNFCF